MSLHLSKCHVVGNHVVAHICFWQEGKNKCCKMFIKYPQHLTGVGRGDNLIVAEKFVCLLYGIEKSVSTVLIMPGIIFL